MNFKIRLMSVLVVVSILLSARLSSAAVVPKFSDRRGYYVAVTNANAYSYSANSGGMLPGAYDRSYSIPPLDTLSWTYMVDFSVTPGYSSTYSNKVYCIGGTIYCGDSSSTIAYGNQYLGHYYFYGNKLEFRLSEFVEHVYEAHAGGDYPVGFGNSLAWQADGHSSVVFVKDLDGNLVFQSPAPFEYHKKDWPGMSKQEKPKDPPPCNFQDFKFKDDIVCEENATRADGKHTINGYPFWYGDPNYNWKPAN